MSHSADPPPLSPCIAAPRPTTLQQRDNLRLALPSKGRMAEDTLQLLRVCSACFGV